MVFPSSLNKVSASALPQTVLQQFLKEVVVPALCEAGRAIQKQGRIVAVTEGRAAAGIEVWDEAVKELDLVVIPEETAKGCRAHVHRRLKDEANRLVPLSELPFPPWFDLPDSFTRAAIFDSILEAHAMARRPSSLPSRKGEPSERP